MPRLNAKQKDKRDKRLPETRVSSGELATAKRNAAAAGLIQSDYQRRACVDGVVVVRQNAVDRQAIKALLAVGTDLRKSGVNINQIAKKLNARNDVNLDLLNQVLSRQLDILAALETLVMDMIDDPQD